MLFWVQKYLRLVAVVFPDYYVIVTKILNVNNYKVSGNVNNVVLIYYYLIVNSCCAVIQCLQAFQYYAALMIW